MWERVHKLLTKHDNASPHVDVAVEGQGRMDLLNRFVDV